MNLVAVSCSQRAPAGGALAVTAGRDITLLAGQNTQSLDSASQSKSKGFLSKRTTTSSAQINSGPASARP